MRRIEQLQGLRLMKFEEVYGRTYRGELSQLEAAEIATRPPALAISVNGVFLRTGSLSVSKWRSRQISRSRAIRTMVDTNHYQHLLSLKSYRDWTVS